MLKILPFVFICLFLEIETAFAQTKTIVFQDAKSGAKVAYVQLFSQDKLWGLSDESGIFRYDVVPAGNICVKVLGYQDTCLNAEAIRDLNQGIWLLTPRSFQMKEVSVTADYSSFRNLDRKYTNTLTQNQIRSIGQPGGEPDLMRSLQLLPGVNKAVEGTADLVVRGGNPDQNLILIDGIPLYNINHFFGLFSSLPVYGVDEVQMYTGAFPAQYGGRLSSIVDVRLKDGNFKEWKGEAGFGLVSLKGYVEGPIVKDKVSVSVGFRQTWLDLVIAPFFTKQERDGIYIGFGDYNAKVSWRINNNQKLSAFFFSARDRFGNRNSVGYLNTLNQRWNNQIFGVSHHYYKEKIKHTSSAAISGYQFGIDERIDFRDGLGRILRNNSSEYNFKLRDFYLQHQVDYYVNNRFRLNYGGQYRRHFASMPQFLNDETLFLEDGSVIGENFFITGDPARTVDEISLFSQNYYNWENTSLGVGIRTGLFFSMLGVTPYVDPRINLKHNIGKKSQISFAFDMNHQSLHEVRLSRVSIATDYMFPMGDDFGLARSLQVESRYQYQLFKNGTAGVAVFNKNFWNLAERAEGLPVLYSESPANLLDKAIGNVYGTETFIEYSGERFFWLASYTYNKSHRQSDEMNKGVKFLSDFNNTHHFKTNFTVALGSRKKRKREFGLAWYIATGVPYTLPTHFLPNPFHPFGDLIAVVPAKNEQFLPSWHRLDFNYKLTRTTDKGRKKTFEINILNVYNQRNIIDITQESRGGFLSPRYVAFGIPFIGIFPTFSYSYAF